MTWPESPGAPARADAGKAPGGAIFESFLSAAEEAAGAGYAVKLPVFEGPLDLLLHLIRLNEVDVTDIPIARIAEQYLEYLELLRELHLDVAAEYLVMAATLAWIKSRMLLPPDGVSEEEEGPDPRAELVARLLEYERFKGAARELDARPLLGRDVFAAGAAPDAQPTGEPELEVSLFQLLEAFRLVLQQARSAGLAHEVEVEPITVRERMIALMDVLERVESAELMDLLRGESGGPPTRTLVVTSFLALLELARLSAVRIYQGLTDAGAPTGPIRLRRAGEASRAGWSARISEWM
ncbi:MAG TPA: segregation/condensation protein A [Myxococcota bacterium]|jgi:segregation and condensation protein A|nr:segregation/condensation protein A [Myxococcota bacterium]